MQIDDLRLEGLRRLNASSCRVSAAPRSAAFRISSASIRDGWPSGYCSRQELACADDGGQDVVEVVSDAARQPADRFHLLRLSQLFLERAEIRDVFRDRLVPFLLAGSHVHLGGRHADENRLTVSSLPAHLGGAARLMPVLLDERLPFSRRLIHIGHAQRQQLGGAVVAEHAGHRGVCLENAAVLG